MSSSQDVVEALQTQLTTGVAGALNTALGGRIYHQQAEQNITLPLLVFDVIAFRVDRHFGSRITYEADIHLDIWVDKAAGTAAAGGAGTLEETLFANLDGVELSVTGMDRGLCLFLDRGVRTIEEDAIRISSDARIIGTTTS